MFPGQLLIEVFHCLCSFPYSLYTDCILYSIKLYKSDSFKTQIWSPFLDQMSLMLNHYMIWNTKSLLWHKDPTWLAPGCLLDLISIALPLSLCFSHTLLFIILCQEKHLHLLLLLLRKTLQFSASSTQFYFSMSLFSMSLHRKPFHYYFSLQYLSPFDKFICLFIFGLLLIKERTLTTILQHWLN